MFQDMVKHDLNTIIELVDILSYSMENYYRVSATLTTEQKELITNLKTTVDDYRTDIQIQKVLQTQTPPQNFIQKVINLIPQKI